jgi:hypothetical protein
MDTQAKLDKVLARIKQNHEDRDAVVDKHKALHLEKLDLEQQLAEESKPKLDLRDGNYFIDTSNGGSNEAFIIIDGVPNWTNGDGVSEIPISEFLGSTYMGNLEDDLKAMQTDLTEFEVADINHGADKAIFDFPDGDSFRLSIKNGYGTKLHIRMKFDTIRKVLAMEATLKRQK